MSSTAGIIVSSVLSRQGVRSGAVLLVLGALGGCPNPKAKFDEFDNRVGVRDGFVAEDMPKGMVHDVSGNFLLSLSVHIAPQLPVQFITETTLRPNGTGALLDIKLQPLKVNTGQVLLPRTALVDEITITGIPVAADGTFVIDFGMRTVPGEANPISGSPIDATIMLHGAIRSTDLFCGNATGMATSPIPINLADGAGSTWAAIRVPPGTIGMALPPPVYVCPVDSVDMSMPPDLTVTPDLTVPPDLSEPPDMAMSMPDMAVEPPDMAVTPPDMAVEPPDMAVTPPDMAVTPDLTEIDLL